MGAQDAMPRGADDVLKRIAELEANMKQVTALAASAAAVKQTLVSPDIGSASASNFVVSTSYTTYASFNFTVPAGFTRALVVANGFVHQSTASTGGDRFWGQVLINGSGGPESTAVATTSMVSGAVAAGYSASLSGLSGGTSISVAIRGHFQTGGNSALFQSFNCAVVTAAVIYLS